MTHGIYGYKTGCRCDVCAAAKRAEGRKYYEKNKAEVNRRQKQYREKNSGQISAKRQQRTLEGKSFRACLACGAQVPLTLRGDAKFCSQSCRNRHGHEVRDREQQRQYRAANAQRTAAYMKTWREANKDHLQEWQRQYREENFDRISERNRQYREDNMDMLAEQQRTHRNKPEVAAKVKERQRRYYEVQRVALALYRELQAGGVV